MPNASRPERIASWQPSEGQWQTDDVLSDALFELSAPFSERWPTSGMTRDGVAYALPTWAHRTADSASSSSPILPTPEAKLHDSGPDYARANRPGSGGDDLTTAIHRELLPTPTARDHKGQNQRRDATCLPGALLPTPTSTDAKGSRRSTARTEEWTSNTGTTLTDATLLLPTPRATDGTKGGPNQRGSSGDLMLPSAVHLLPTPTTAMASGGNANRSGERSDELLLPGVARQIAESSGDHTGQPSNDGSEPSADPHPHQPSPAPKAANG